MGRIDPRHWSRTFVSLVCSVALTVGLVGCRGDEAWTTYTAEDGLAHDAVESVAAGPDGVLWAGTHAGVSGFDGQQWTTYTNQDAPIDSPSVDAMTTGPDGVLWVGSWEGVASFDGERWTAHEGLPDWPVTAVTVIGEEGALAASDGVYRFDGERWERIEGSPHAEIGSFAVGGDGTVWMATRTTSSDGEVLFEFDGQEWSGHVGGEDADGTADGEVVPGRLIRAVAVDGDGVLWAGTDQGLASHEDGQWARHSVEDGLPHKGVRALTVDHDDEVWVATVEEGVPDPEHAVTRFDGQQWTSYTTEDGLPDGWVNDLTVDDNGTVWAATDAGLARFDAR